METSLTPKRRVTHYGVVRFGEMGCDAVVLDDGSRGYLRRQLAELIGLHSKNPSNRFANICADFSPKSLSLLVKSESPILMLHGGNGQFFSEKHHQWLSARGLERLTQQIHSVTAIARCSANYRDFDHRCEAAFAGGALQLGLLHEDFEDAA